MCVVDSSDLCRMPITLEIIISSPWCALRSSNGSIVIEQ